MFKFTTLSISPSPDNVHNTCIQAARLPRLIRVHHTIKDFFFKIVGDGTKLLGIILLTGIFLMLFAVINIQLFGYIEPSNECEEFGEHFDNFFLVCMSEISHACMSVVLIICMYVKRKERIGKEKTTYILHTVYMQCVGDQI